MDKFPKSGRFYVSVQTIGGSRGLDAFPHLLGICLSEAETPAYRWYAARRIDAPHVIFQLTLSGRGVFRRKRDRWDLTPGKAFLCESYDPSVTYLYPRDGVEPWRFFFVTFSGDAAVQMVRDLVRESGGVFDFPIKHPLLGKFASFLGEGRESAVMSLADSWRLVMELLHALLIAQDQRHGGRESDHALIHRAHDLLRDTHGERINVSALASRLNVSREHLTRVFAEATGEPPYRFIMRMRLQQSCNLLKNTDLSVKEIASRMGFGSVSEFCRPFKRLLRLSPTEFRTGGIMPVFDGGAIDFIEDEEG